MSFTHFGILPFVQAHADSIHLLNRSVKVGLKVSVCAERFFNVTNLSVFGVELNRLEVFNIFAVEEHVSNGSSLLVDLDRVTSENDSLGDDARWIGREEASHCYQVRN